MRKDETRQDKIRQKIRRTSENYFMLFDTENKNQDLYRIQVYSDGQTKKDVRLELYVSLK